MKANRKAVYRIAVIRDFEIISDGGRFNQLPYKNYSTALAAAMMQFSDPAITSIIIFSDQSTLIHFSGQTAMKFGHISPKN